jgi:hypothetical protein
MKLNYKISKQQGLFSAILAGLLLLVIVVAVIAYIERSSPSGVTELATSAKTSVLINQGTDLKIGFERLVYTGITPSSITFDQVVGTGLFDTTPGASAITKPTPPPGLTVLPAVAAFTYNQQVKLPGIGATGTADYVASVGNLSLSACQLVNKNLFGDLSTAIPAVSTGSTSAWTTAPAAIDDSSNVSINYVIRPEGCVKTSDGAYVYYKAIVEN